MFEYGSPIGRRSALRRLTLALGSIATAPLASGLLAGCRTPGDLDAYAFEMLNADQQKTLAALVDQIIPATDTPGASDVGVPQFIDQMLADWYAPDERDAFLAGLTELDQRAGGSFAGLDDDARAALVTALDREEYASAPDDDAVDDAVDDDVAEAGREGTFNAQQEEDLEVAGMQGALGAAQSDSSAAEEPAPADGPSFYRQVKELTLAGYYTSEPGATEELQWVAAPGRWTADAPLSEIGRAWA